MKFSKTQMLITSNRSNESSSLADFECISVDEHKVLKLQISLFKFCSEKDTLDNKKKLNLWEKIKL